LEQELLDEAWRSLVAGSAPEPTIVPPPLHGTADGLTSRFPVAETATACVATALRAAAALQLARTGVAPALAVDRGHVAAAVRSERYFRSGTASTGMGFAPLSRFWRAADGWVRTHANYRWHRRALLEVLGVPSDADAVAAAIAQLRAEDVERSVFEAGGVATAVRSLADWRRHPQGAAVHAEPLVAHRFVPGAAPRRSEPTDRPMGGRRVLDLTRVIAGPVCTRYLSVLGAEVLRLDPPEHPDLAPDQTGDTLLGKRSAFLDIATGAGRVTLEGLLRTADVVVCGYRPGALERHGLAETDLVEGHPGLVVVYLDAWGHAGPWAGRRGFDSVVQAPTGIASGESTDGEEPGALPCQLLDHGTGYLAAAAALDGVRRQQLEGGTHIRRLSLARTAAWLTSRSVPAAAGDPAPPGDERAWLTTLDDAAGPVRAVAPPGELGGEPLQWSVAGHYGRDQPQWATPA
jgi:crotonobetainyl-CoA:carnitine CoA-transferase CaiB-like acyl-CoA transferase